MNVKKIFKYSAYIPLIIFIAVQSHILFKDKPLLNFFALEYIYRPKFGIILGLKDSTPEGETKVHFLNLTSYPKNMKAEIEFIQNYPQSVKPKKIRFLIQKILENLSSQSFLSSVRIYKLSTYNNLNNENRWVTVFYHKWDH